MIAELELLKALIQKAETQKKEAQSQNYSIEWEYSSIKSQYERDQNKLKKKIGIF